MIAFLTNPATAGIVAGLLIIISAVICAATNDTEHQLAGAVTLGLAAGISGCYVGTAVWLRLRPCPCRCHGNR